MPVVFPPGSKRGRFYVYRLINRANGLPFYIGYTSDLSDRFKAHTRTTPGSAEGNARWLIICSLADAGLPLDLVVDSTFTFRGKAMKRESAIIRELQMNSIPILNYLANDLHERVATHLSAIATYKRNLTRALPSSEQMALPLFDSET